MKLRIILYSEPVQNTLQTSFLKDINKESWRLCKSSWKMFGWPELNKKNYKKVTVANQRSFLLFEGILGFSVPSIILADLLGNRCLVERIQKVMSLWLVDFDPFWLFLSFIGFTAQFGAIID